MRIHDGGEKSAPVMIMLPGSFCNADSMANIISRLETTFRILAVDYSGQYAESEKPFTSRAGEAVEIIRYLQSHAFLDGGPFLCFPKIVSRLLGKKFKTIVGNLRGKTLEEALREPTIVKFSGGKPERYSNLLGPICQNAAFMSDETLEREADACVTFDYPTMDEEFQRHMYFFYSKEESAWRFCHRKLKKAYPLARYKLVSGYGHVGYPGEHLTEYCGWLAALARGDHPFAD